MAMDAKDLRIESALGARGDDGNTKFAQSGTAVQTNGNKPYHNVRSNALAKVDVPAARPCAIIGPDRVVPPQSMNAAFLKKVPVEPWPCSDNIYQHPPEYPLKPAEYLPSRNISPRQTFQENMQRIMVPPSYASVKHGEDNCLKNPKFSDVPYTISTINNEPKSVKSSEGLLPNNSPNQPVIPNGWASGGVNVRPLRPYGAPELYQYSEYPNYPAPRPISMIRPHRNVQDVPPEYQERLYGDANIRYKPYPTAKDRPLHHPQARYEYIPNYPGMFHPHGPYPPHKYDLQKTIPTHAYSMYPSVPLKYLDRRMPATPMEKFSRSPAQQVSFNAPFCNQNIPSTYGSVAGNCMPNRGYPYAPDPSTKNMIPNKIYYDANNVHKYYTSPENIFMNDNINRPTNHKADVLYPSYPSSINIHSVPPHHMYRKESSIKGFDQAIHYRNFEYSANINPLGRVPLQFLPQTMSMSSDSNTSNDTTHIVGNTQDDFGYVSQSSTASIKSIESGVTKMSSDVYRRNNVRHDPNSHLTKSGQKPDNNVSSKDKKDINVRQFLEMWNEGEDEGNENKARQRDPNNSLGHYESSNPQEPLYVLDLVNVPNEELAKYEHIQKISKLPENIKGYNSIELLNQYEKLVESPGLNHFAVSPIQSKQKDIHVPLRNGILRHGIDVVSANARPLSPLDVEAKISQSVIHKEVGCNFEIRPCSPQMMNVELATPVHNVLGERLIEKVVNSVKSKSPLHHRIEENNNHSSSRNSPKVTSCKMATNQYLSPNLNDPLKTNYCLQDLEGNSGVCLASLPRLDNEIELNFPEINQQFINANKISSMQDLPTLDTEIDATANKSKSKIYNHPFIPESIHSGSESDKEVSKLSKYRKNKRNSILSENSNMSYVSHPRTDSVIIKNPENVKCQEDINNMQLVGKITSVNENIEKPLNFSTENDRALNNSAKNFTETIYKTISDYDSLDVRDTAIDFSINKSDDEQNININNLNNISDALQNNIEIIKNIYVNSETLDCSIDKCDKNISKQLEDISDDFTLLQPKSPALGTFTCSSELQNIDFKSSHDSNEMVISSSNPQELESDIKLSTTSSIEKIISQNHSMCMSHDVENITTCHQPKNYSTSSVDLNSQTQNYDLVENSDNIVPPICQPKYDLTQENQTDYDTVAAISNEDHSKSNEQKHYIISEDDTDRFNTHLEADLKNSNDHEDLRIQENEYDKIQTAFVESEISSETKAIIPVSEKDILKSKTESEVDIFVEFKADKNNDCSKKYTNENSVKIANSNTIELDYIKPGNNDDLMNVSNNDFDSVQIECKKGDDFENNKTISEIGDGNIMLDINYKIKTSPLRYSEPTIVRNQIIPKSGQVICRKELFSSRFQNLYIYNEGFCSSQESIESQNTKKAIQNITENCFYSELADNNTKTVKETMNEVNTICLEATKSSERVVVSEKNEESSIEVEVENPALADVKTISGSPITDLDGENDTELISNLVKDVIDNPTIVLNNQTSESLDKVADNTANNNDKLPENIVDSNMKLNSNIKESMPVAEKLICSNLPNRRNRTLKRSLSESAVNSYNTLPEDLKGNFDNNFIHGKKRPKIANTEILVESQMITENFASFIQSNRRNSISTLYNEENVSFCIVIDNDCVLTEENESGEKICYTELSDDDCLTTICTDGELINPELNEEISYDDTAPMSVEEVINSELTEYFPYENDVTISANANILNPVFDSENIFSEKQKQCEQNDLILQEMEVKTVEESWVEDIACIETVFSDDVAEDVIISAPSTPKDTESSEEESDITSFMYNVNENDHTDRVKYIYGSQMCDDDALLVEKLYRTPQMDVNKTLIDRETQFLQGYNRYYDNESLEKILSECNTLDTCTSGTNEALSDKSAVLPHNITCEDLNGNKENLKDVVSEQQSREGIDGIYAIADLSPSIQTKVYEEKKSKTYDDCNLHSCKSSCDNFDAYKKEDKVQYAISSSPEVSSTTPEEKGPGILLTIRSYKGTKISEVNEMSESFKHSHSQRFGNSLSMSRPLLTKAAQKYIPPLKETMRDLKVKIRLPKQSLYKLQQLKNSKEEPKIETSRSKHYIKSLPQESPKKAKPKPKFEDVLMSIDEIQFKKHKEKNKKPKQAKQAVPKVIIKKNENGAHYASTETKETYNPDLTGRKWQPWVFLEKSNFVDKMALKKKFKAIYSHRKKTFVLAENFRKYKSISTPKFVISHPKYNDNISTGNLKYTIRLKHT